MTKKRIELIAPALGLAAALIAAAPARADTESFTSSTISVSAGNSQNVFFTPFDPSLGALTSITVDLSNMAGNGSIAITGTAPFPFAQIVDQGTASDSVTNPTTSTQLGGATVNATAGCLYIGPFACQGFGNPTFVPFSPTSATLSDGGTLSAFESAATADLTVHSGTPALGPNVFFSGFLTNGTITITYNYTVDAPEPASIGLLVSGIAALGWQRRRAVQTRV